MQEDCKIQDRYLYLDVLRVVATIAVVFLHVSAKGFSLPVTTFDWYFSAVSDSFVRWAVPMFVMISGALFLRPEKEVTIHRILTKNVKRLIIAYLFWYLAYACFDLAIFSLKSGTLSFEKRFLEPEFHLWFLPMLMGVYFLVPLLRKMAVDDTLLLYSLFLWGAYITIGFLIERDIPQISPLFNMNIVIGYTGFFLLGYYLSRTSLVKRQCLVIYALGLMGLFITVAGCIWSSLNRGSADVRFLSELSPQVAMMAAALFLWVKNRSSKLGSKTATLVGFCRDDMFGVYLIHVFWIWFFDRLSLLNMGSYAITIPLVTLGVFSFSLFSAKLLRRIPVFKSVVS